MKTSKRWIDNGSRAATKIETRNAGTGASISNGQPLITLTLRRDAQDKKRADMYDEERMQPKPWHGSAGSPFGWWIMLRIGPKTIAWLERKQAAHLWGQKHFIKPVFIRQALGAGNLLLAVTPLNTRPNYYLIRIDSAWLKKDDTETIYDHLDEIQDAIEDECGSRDYEDDDGKEQLAEWPALNLHAGISWCDSNDLLATFRRRRSRAGK